MIPSRFTFVHPIGDGKLFLYHSILLEKLIITEEEWNKAQSDETSNEAQILYKKGFFVRDPSEDERVLEEARGLSQPPIELDTLVIIPTYSCNFDCKYCYARHARLKGDMSLSTLRQALRAYVARATKNFNNIFFLGGEPLLNYGVIQHTYKYLKELHETGKLGEYGIAIATNGSLFDSKKAEEAYNNKVFVAFSLDGFKRNNVLRTSHGRDTTDLTLKGIKEAKKAGLDYSINATVTKYNVDELDEIAEYFITGLGAKSIGFTLLLGDYPFKPDVRYATKQVIKAYETAASYGVEESRIGIQVRSFIYKSIRLFDCRASLGEVVVTPEGYVGPSPELLDDKHLEKDLNFDVNNSKLFLEWVRANPLNMKKCQNCEYIGICGGGSHYNRIARAGTIWEPDPDFCEYMDEFFKWVLKKLIK